MTLELGSVTVPGLHGAQLMRDRARHVSKRLLGLASVWVASYLLWLLFADSTAPAELVVGVAAATIATWGVQAVEVRRLAQLAPRARWLARALWLPWYVLVDTGRILAVLLRQLVRHEPAHSLLFATPYDANGDEDEAATKRALAIAYTTMTPNSIVIGVDTSRGLLFFHQLRESPTSRMTRSLGAKA